ncbi:hypothetical protein V5T82_11750 [Magnetovibrio sp. PR-2]|uniref:hypothetical protein n=1 Tax=Magnetovibrio sp. PR-2 TaxID=3120356 RepID=UPI002FCE2363
MSDHPEKDTPETEFDQDHNSKSSGSTGTAAPATPPTVIPVWRYVLGLPWQTQLSGPFIYGMIVPIFFLDVCLVIYQAVCFRLWGIARAPRSDFIVIDRHKLTYLNAMEKFHCMYCGYANGVMAFGRELAARTEYHWCPIKHASRIPAPHAHYEAFVDFGDDMDWASHPSRKVDRRAREDGP